MHDWLFASQNNWAGAANPADQFRQQALAFGVDAAKYDACLKDALTDARIQRDLQDGNNLGVRGTPAFFLNKVDAQGKAIATKTVSGALPFDQFDQMLKALLGQ
jgi:protein-disulfide isomerase